MSDPVQNVIEIIRAADDLERFLHKNAGDNDDWPIDLVARDDDSAKLLSEKLNRLNDSLKIYRCNVFGLPRAGANEAHQQIRAFQFQEAVEEACIVSWVDFKDTDHPAEILVRLVKFESESALDPAISKPALDLKNTYAGPVRKLLWKIKSWWISRRSNYF